MMGAHRGELFALPGIDPGEVSPEDLARLRGLCDPKLLSSAFQPIFSAKTGEFVGCEALLRLPPESGFSSPAAAFRMALASGVGVDLEVAAAVRSLEDAEPFVGELLLFLNIVAPALTDPRFGPSWLVERVAATARSPGQVVLELPELVEIRDFAALERALDPYRREGFRIAIDDFGAGYTNLRMITDLHPDFVKIDRGFVEGIRSHARKRILVESLVSLCHRINCQVVAEGIESGEDLETCLWAGVDYLQGFLLARPAPAEEAFVVDDLALPSSPRRAPDGEIETIVRAVTPLGPDEPLSAGFLRFSSDPGMRWLPQVLDGRATGLLSHETAAEWLRRPGVAPEAALRDPVSVVSADVPFDRLPVTATLDDACNVVRLRPAERKLDPIVVVDESRRYVGLLTVDALLDEFARLRLLRALETNPVTRLPGRARLEEALSDRLRAWRPVALVRLNVQRFRLYNERHGFSRGDSLLAGLGALLRESLLREPDAVLAHFAGDDFAALVPPGRAEALAREAIALFATYAPSYHDPEDAAARSFSVRDARGHALSVPLVSLVAGIAVWRGPRETSVPSITREAERALRQAQQSSGAAPIVVREAQEVTSDRASTLPIQIRRSRSRDRDPG